MTDNSTSATLTLPAELTIANVTETKKQAETLLASHHKLILKSDGVSRIDTAGAQFIAALARHGRNDGIEVEIGPMPSAVVDFALGIGIEPNALQA